QLNTISLNINSEQDSDYRNEDYEYYEDDYSYDNNSLYNKLLSSTLEINTSSPSSVLEINSSSPILTLEPNTSTLETNSTSPSAQDTDIILSNKPSPLCNPVCFKCKLEFSEKSENLTLEDPQSKLSLFEIGARTTEAINKIREIFDQYITSSNKSTNISLNRVKDNIITTRNYFYGLKRHHNESISEINQKATDELERYLAL
ncbi:2651_t:CDS:2, partial [Dentiscutata erythropus]